jgi:aminobenzoyl-glutamate transport protein
MTSSNDAETPPPDSSAAPVRRGGILGFIERVGNALPDPVFLFVYLIIGLFAASIIAAAAGWSAVHPGTGEKVGALSLLSADNLQKLLVEMPVTFAHFHPLGYVLVVMLGAGLAERTGLLGTAMRAGVRCAPRHLLTPAVAFVAMMGNLAADAAYVVLIPLSGVLYAAAGRHPVAGITTAFAGVSGGFSANLLPGQLDALLFGITEKAVETLDPAWNANIAGNWYFIAAMLILFLPVIWWVTDRVVEPRLGKWNADGQPADENHSLTPEEKRGLKRAGLATLGIVLLWVALVFGPGTPLVNESASAEARLSPLYQSLVAAFFLLFFTAGWAYGSATGALRNHRDAVRMMSESMKEMAYYLVLAFFAAHFVQMFQWSNMGLLMAIDGANVLKSSGLPVPVLLCGVVLLTASVNLFIGSASAKWLLLAPVLVPMLMLLGISPEMTTATYRVGDSVTNIVTPLMVYFPLVLTFCQRWMKDCGMGTLLASMIPYSLWLLVTGLGLVIGWVLLDLPLGPGGAAVYLHR